jgi:guanidinopropionase
MKQASSQPRYVSVPGLLRAERGDGSFALYHPGHGTSLEVEAESGALVSEALEGFAEPIDLESFHGAHPDLPEQLLELLVSACFVVDESELAFLEHGFLRPTASPIGPACGWSELPDVAQEDAFVVVGVPADMAAQGEGGARHGPSEIRKVVNGALLSGEFDVVDYEFLRLYPDFQPHVCDLGDIDADGGRMDHVGARLGKVVREIFALGMKPLVLGGDHSLTHYVLKERIARGEPFGIIHFDAHADMGPSSTLSHANVFGLALESPVVSSILQIGLRGTERVSPFARRVPCPKRTIVSARMAQAGAALRALEALPRDVPYYLSFDIDCIDPSLAAETGTPLFGGLSFTLALDLVDHIARSLTLLGADFVEVAGKRGPSNGAALIAASLLQRCLLGGSAYEPLTSDVYLLKP